MPSIKRPRYGSLQFWPRKRAKKMYSRVRSWIESDKVKSLGFIGYKVGMTQLHGVVENKHSHLKGEEIAIPTTILECPPMRILSARFYVSTTNGSRLAKEVFFKTEKILGRKTNVKKDNSKELDGLNPNEYSRITITVYTQPNKTGFGKKKPEVVEMALGGSNQKKLDFIKQNLDKEIELSSVFEENQMLDIRGVTKAKGFQGPVKRFGIGLKSHKSEKGRRAPGSLGPWVRQQHISWRVAHAGQTGFHQRTEYNKQILKISDDIEAIGKDFHKYGNVKSTYVLIHGSVSGPKKRAVVLTECIRPKPTKHKLVLE